MNENFLVELARKREGIISLINRAAEYNWINQERANELITGVENEVLTIGVIGQMKCGKSTFLNSFVFEKDILPSATTPMTAALSVITYGEKESVEAEFYTLSEWSEIKMQASRSIEGVNREESNKIKAAKELVDKSMVLGSSIDSILGKKQSDSLDNLIEYVGADGKYIAVTKSVTIKYPKDYLKGVEIVDTPGFNDPIVSREERTKDFLKRADVVILMLYAGRAFDSSDRDILFKHVGSCGIGKVLIGINKYDLPYASGESCDEMLEYVQNEIRKACKETNDDKLIAILKETTPILLSAEMALLSSLPMDKINSSDSYKHSWDMACDNFEISSQTQMREKSKISDLIAQVKEMIDKEKGDILIRKPINAILASGTSKLQNVESQLNKDKELVKNLSKPNFEIEEQQEQLERAEKRIRKKLNLFDGDLEDLFRKIIKDGRIKLEDDVDETISEIKRVVNDKSRFKGWDAVNAIINEKSVDLSTRKLKRTIMGLSDDAKYGINRSVREFTDELIDIFNKYLSDMDANDFARTLEQKVSFDVEDRDLFSDATDEEDGDEEFKVVDFILECAGGFINGYTFGLAGVAGNLISHSETARELSASFDKFKNNFDPEPYLNKIMGNKDHIVDLIHNVIIEDLISPLKEQLDDILKRSGDKEQRLNAAKQSIDDLQREKSLINEQLANIKTMI
ncbi:MAG: dynamin family protein [Rikenellaceae bacterium]